MNLIAPDTPESRLRSETGSPDMAAAGKQAGSGDSDPFMDLLFSGWNPDLPEPSVLDH
jgi:hypothetical protein